MESEQGVEKASLFATVNKTQVVQVALIGVAVGVFGWIFAEVLGMYVFRPASCAADAFVCAASSQPAVILASILAAFLGLFGLVKLQVFRPLFVVIASTLGLWGIVGQLTALSWIGSLASTAVLYMVAYLAFMWIARIRTFWLVLVLSVLLVVGLRLIITA